MSFLLPHRFKKIGAFAAPLGFTYWLAMQLGYITKLITYFHGDFHDERSGSFYDAGYHFMGFFSFISFLFGIYLVTFSKEKVEDEMVQRTRLDSFQFAALAQIIFTITGFLLMLLLGSPREGVLMLFFVVLLLLFWVCFVGRFNYILHVKFRP